MDKEELVKLLKELEIPINEGIQNDKETNVYPRIVFWDYYWKDLMASGSDYDTKVTYQVSFFSKIPRHPKLIKLKKRLNEKKLHPDIEHEYIQNKQYFHSFFPLEVLENIERDV